MATSYVILAQSGAKSAQDIRNLDHSVVQFSPSLWSELKEIRTFLFENMYRAPRVMQQRERAAQVVRDLFEIFMTSPEAMPGNWGRAVASNAPDLHKARVVADYIAGMTDRFAQQEHDRLHTAR